MGYNQDSRQDMIVMTDFVAPTMSTSPPMQGTNPHTQGPIPHMQGISPLMQGTHISSFMKSSPLMQDSHLSSLMQSSPPSQGTQGTRSHKRSYSPLTQETSHTHSLTPGIWP